MKSREIQSVEKKKIDEIIQKYEGKESELLGVLEETQKINQYQYLPDENLEYISYKTNIPLSQIYSVSTFYSFFNMKPQGEHTLIVCRGTACHTKGSKALLDNLGLIFNNIDREEAGEPFFTTPDNKFTIRTVACFGLCALAPVVSVDGIIYSRMTLSKLKKIIWKITKGGIKNDNQRLG